MILFWGFFNCRVRERELLKKVHDTIDKGGKVGTRIVTSHRVISQYIP